MQQVLSCRNLAKLAGVSVRTLRYYDKIGLLRPASRSEARYRHYGPAEQLRLQQILFYKELDFSLDEIRQLLADPAYDLPAALQRQRQALAARQARLTVLLATIDNTIKQLTTPHPMLTPAELYAGFPPATAATYRHEAATRHGAEVVQAAEQHLQQLGKEALAHLNAEREEITEALYARRHLPPASPEVQAQVARHCQNIRAFWGPKVGAGGQLAAAYQGLGQLYVDDPRFTTRQGQPRPEFAQFLGQAMRHFAATQLQGQ
jgi:DNA-binding transcriptional MerR regulator